MNKASMFAALLAFVLMAGCADRVIIHPSTTGMVGRWQGTASPIVTWCRQKELGFSMTIQPDGKVEGRIGDAAIEDGILVLQNGPGTLTYLVKAKLRGPIVRAEEIERKSIIIFVDFAGDRIIGSYRTDGTVFGGRKSMVMDGDLVDIRKVAE